MRRLAASASIPATATGKPASSETREGARRRRRTRFSAGQHVGDELAAFFQGSFEQLGILTIAYPDPHAQRAQLAVRVYPHASDAFDGGQRSEERIECRRSGAGRRIRPWRARGSLWRIRRCVATTATLPATLTAALALPAAAHLLAQAFALLGRQVLQPLGEPSAAWLPSTAFRPTRAFLGLEW
jgi:hypothetical protein